MPEIITRCYFYGVASPYVYECIEIAGRLGVQIAGFIHNRPELPCPGDLYPLFTFPSLEKCDRQIPVIFPMITPGFRKIALAEARENGFLFPGSLLDPTSVVARSVIYDEGFQVNAGSVVGAKCRFGRQVLVNRSASIGHDVIAGDFISFGPGCVVTGNCTIGKGVFIGAGAVIMPGLSIGENSIIGAGAVVTAAVPAHSVIVGNPGRVIKTGIKGYQDVSV
jgi:sugar O-acyltransferase (sialic acid O-acetyltransferase NeuD family)